MDFYLSWYTVPLLFGFLQGIVYIILLLVRGFRQERLADKLLAGVLLLLAMRISQWMLGYAGWYDRHNWESIFMFYFPFNLMILLGPTFYFYFRSLTNRNFQLKRKDIWHFVPGIILLGCYSVSFLVDIVAQYWIVGNALPEHFGTKGVMASFQQDYVLHFFQPLIMLSIVLYAMMTIKEYAAYKKYLYDHFSDTTPLEFHWIQIVLWTFVITFGFNFLYYITSFFVSFDYDNWWTSFMTMAIAIYFISISGFSVTRSAISLQYEPATVEDTEKKPTVILPELEEWKDKVQALMEKEQVYLNPDLTLQELAERLKTNTSVLSKAINSGFGQNFNNYINQYRVQAMQEKMLQPSYKHYTLVSIAFECGFNSKATFNRSFKKFTDMSPKVYLETQLAKKVVKSHPIVAG